jgi:hypothetical protein
VSGGVSGYTQTNSITSASTVGSLANVVQNTVTSGATFSTSLETLAPTFASLPAVSALSNVTQSSSPLDQMSGSGGEEVLASDGVAQSVGDSLGGGKTYTVSRTLIPGVLRQIVVLSPRKPHGVPSADEDYSSWGNEALWRW